MIFRISGTENDVENDVYDQNFPIDNDMNTTEMCSRESFKILFNLSLEKRIPEYIIAITEVNTTNKSDDKIKNKKTFNIYDGYLFLSYYNSKFDPLDPRTNLPIQKVYYFAVCCFFPELLMYKYEKRSHTFEPHFISRPDQFDKINITRS